MRGGYRLAMTLPRIALLAAIILAVAVPTSAGAAHAKRCEGIGDTITKLRAKQLRGDTARTLSAKWAETAAGGGGWCLGLETALWRRWRDPDSNRGHHDFQSCALPTELSRRARTG